MTRSAERRLAVPVQGDPRSPATDDDAAEVTPATTAQPDAATAAADAAEAWSPVADAGAGPTISRLADDLLPVLIARLEASSLGEIEISRDGWRVRLRRAAAHNPGPPAAPHSRGATDRRAGPASESASDSSAREPGAGTAAADAGPSRPERDRTVITAPAVGYYLPREELHVGLTVRSGDLLGHVDVLGLRQEVVVPADGRLTRLLAEPGEAVEYGQPLARLEPESRS